jgi:hypothetical protein
MASQWRHPDQRPSRRFSTSSPINAMNRPTTHGCCSRRRSQKDRSGSAPDSADRKVRGRAAEVLIGSRSSLAQAARLAATMSVSMLMAG